MRTYSYVRLMVDGKETSELEILREGNVFSVFENDENVFMGSYLKVMAYIDDWKNKKKLIVTFLKEAGRTVSYEQTIK